MNQGRLPFDVPVSIVEQEFLRYIETVDGSLLAAQVKKMADALIERGWKHYGIKAIFEAIRFDRAIALGPDAMGVKVNNNHTAYMARYLIDRYPYLKNFFELRTLHGRAWRKRTFVVPTMHEETR